MSLRGNRKLLVATTTLLAAFVLALAGRLTGEFVTIVSIAVGGFFAANALGDHRGGGSPGNREAARR